MHVGEWGGGGGEWEAKSQLVISKHMKVSKERDLLGQNTTCEFSE